MWYAMILGGGLGSRMQAGRNKVILSLDGEMMLLRSIRKFRPHVDGMVVVTRPEERETIRAAMAEANLLEGVIFADAGETRQASVRSGLNALPEECRYVLIHDGARCLIDRKTIARVKESVAACGTGIAAIRVTDTIKQVDEQECARSTPDRTQLRAVQTPQGFDKQLILEAHAYAEQHNYLGTDDASLVEYMGRTVQLVEGSRRNIKLTTPEDMMIAEAFLTHNAPLPQLRIGQGYDVHRLVEERKLILCGVEIPHTHGLLGHSDADVAVHALMDAMLGAMALGDIGRHFPDTDPRYSGISSMKLLAHVVQLLTEHHARVTNVDVTIVAQKPKLLPHIPQMRANVAAALALPLDRVNVKATTTERLGFEGRMEGISAQAVCMVQTF